MRHLRGRGKKKNPVSKAQSSKKTPDEEKVLTETQQINMQPDELLKNHKKQKKEYGSNIT